MPEARSSVLLALTVGIATFAGAADVAVLKSSDVAAWKTTLEAFRKGTTAHKVTEFDLRGDRSEGERALAGFKGKAVIVVTLGPLAAQVAREVMPEAALVYGMVQDPARLGLTNPPPAAGVTFTIPVKNQLAAFRLVFPRGVRIGFVSSDDAALDEVQKAGALLRVMLVGRKVASERDVPQALRDLLRGPTPVDALWVPADAVLLGEDTRRFILAETLKAGRPIFGFSAALVAEGALVSDGPDLTSVGEQLADLVNRIASGDKASRGTVLVPRAELVINRKIAQKLQIDIPDEALRAASKVF